jgi:hypothetical protein
MPATVAHAIKVLEERSSQDAALAEAVVFLAAEAAGAEGPDRPFDRPAGNVLQAATLVNERRQRERREEAASAALPTAQVVELLASIGDRKGVDRRRRRGQLLGWRAGGRTLHPAWQFDPRRGDTRPGLSTVLEALSEVTPDPQAADALMRAPREDVDGRSLADLLAAGDIESVLRLVRAARDQS